jgi:hypothetical protein
MVSTRVGCGALLLLAVALTGAACAPAYYAEYALAEGAPADSVHCYDGCMRSTLPDFRQACFAHCGGVVATKTVRPCEQPGRERCTWQALAQPSEPETTEAYEETSDEETSDATVAAAVIGSLLDVLVFAATAPPTKRTQRVEQHVHQAPARPSPRIPARPRPAPNSERADTSKHRR